MTERKDKRKLSPIHDDPSPQKQAAVDLPEREQEIIDPVVVAETKRKQGKYKSSEEENSSGSGSNLPINQIKISNPLDTNLKHMLTNCFSTIGDKHDI